MKYILSTGEMRLADKTATDEYGIPSIILMENAARSASDIIKSIINNNSQPVNKLLILCGSGNNGGDGFAIGRHLHEDFNITIYWIGSEEKMSPETKMNYMAATKLNLTMKHL